MELKWHWALLVVLFGVSVGYMGRSIVSYVKAPNQSTLVDADYSAPPSSWVVYRFIQWADQALVYLRSKLVPPPYAALQLATSHFTSQALRLAAKLGIADLVGGGSKTVQELAEATGVREDNLYRILRALAAHGYFAEEAPRVFRNTDLSAVLRKDHPSSVRNLVLVHHDHLHWGGSEGMLLTLTEGIAGWRLRLTGESLWDYYDDNRPENEVFNQAVAETNALRGTAVLDDYDFSHFKHVVDVGGGRGNFVSRLLRRYVNMTATIIDQQHVIDEAREEWHQRYGPRVTGYEERVVLEAGDFMEAIPAGGDCYLLKGILSQLDDEQALVLLRNVRKAMTSGGEQKLVLVEADFIRPHDTRQLNLALDLVSLAVYQGRGRTQDELKVLLATAGFTLRRAVDTRSPFTVIEAVPQTTA